MRAAGRVLGVVSMNDDLELRCRCGNVHGRVRDVSPRTVNRVVCYCDDCQAYVHHLGRAELLDAHGGTDIVQVSPATLTFDRGMENIAGVRLGPKGLYRWYATCCKTPLGNTASPAIPFIGIPDVAFGDLDASRRDVVFGKAWGILGKFAVGGPPEGSTKPNLRGIARVVRLIAGGKLRGRGWPNPFFEQKTRAPRYALTTLSAEEREALRPLCGPNPTRPAL